MLRRMTGLLAATLLCAAGAYAQEPAKIFDPGALKGPAKGRPNEVLVLGTPHLAGLKDPFRPAGLKLVNERLAAWKPQIIAIEALSGMQCDHARRVPHRYKDMVEEYCWDPAPARAATGLDAALHALLEDQRVKRNEDTLVAALLAAALGLERVVAMDDHTADAAVADEKAYEAAIRKAWDNPATARRRKMDAADQPRLGDPEGVLALYRSRNDPAQARLAFDSDFGAALEEGSPQQFGRNYLGSWETRNLRMASNIRDAIAAKPGSRTLVIVGASHKGYLEAYLNQMHDVRIVDALQVLR
jgi:Family of unknown function (DUF5694)